MLSRSKQSCASKYFPIFLVARQMRSAYSARVKLARFCKGNEVEPLLPEDFQRLKVGARNALSPKHIKSPRERSLDNRFSMHSTMFYSGRAYCRPSRPSLPPGVMLNKCELALIFIAGIFTAFPSMYINDALVPLSTYLPYYYKGITDSAMGWLTSVSFLPSLVVTVLMAPLIDKHGPVAVGIFCCIWFVAVSVLMPFVQKSFSWLLVTRILFGLFSESSWIVQASLIAKYMPVHLESFGFGFCMSISTAAALLCFGTIPPLFSSIDLSALEGPEPEAHAEYLKLEKSILLSYWLSVAIAVLSLVIFVACSMPFTKIDRKARAAREEHLQRTAFVPALPVYINNTILPRLPARPNRSSHAFFLKQLINLPPDFWLITFGFSILLAVCESCQTLLLTFIQVQHEEITSHTVEYFGVVRTLFAVIFGPLCGILAGAVGKRPLLGCITYISITVAFVLIMFLPAWYNLIPMAIIGIADGGSSAFLKSLFSRVVGNSQINIAYAISESFLNVYQFILPPLAGFVSDIFRLGNGKSYGIPLTFTGVLLIGTIVIFISIRRDKSIFRGRLSSRT